MAEQISEAASSTDASARPADGPTLSAIVCPLTLRELPTALANLELWERKLVPAVAERPPHLRQRLIFSFNCGPNEAAEMALRNIFDRGENLRRSFADLEVIFLDLPPEKDLYIRFPTGEPPQYGNKAGPNWMFYETVKRLRESCRFIFLMETDCQPLVTNWLTKLDRICVRNDDAWIVGAHYSGASPLNPSVARHINGNALYHVGSSEFATFLDDILWPWMHRYIQDHDPNLAYDCAWETFLNREEMDYFGHADWLVGRSVFHRFRLCDAIVNIGGHAEQTGQFIWTRQQLLARSPGAIIAHGPVSASGTHRRGRFSLGKLILTSASIEEGGVLKLDGQDGKATRSLWPEDGSFGSEDMISVLFTVSGEPGAGAAVELRDQVGKLLTRKRVILPEDGVRKAKLEYNVTQRHNFVVVAIATSSEGEVKADAQVSGILLILSRNGEIVGRIRDVLD